MGCITSRGPNWPPRPYKRIVVRNEMVDQIVSGEIKKLPIPVEDYVWVYPGAEIRNGGGGGRPYADDPSPWEENAIRSLEDG
jgi:hypothetical protein